MGDKIMKLAKTLFASLALASLVASPVVAKKKEKTYAMVNEDLGIPVFPYDIDNKPYVIVAGIEAGVRKATIFSKEPSQKKIYNELWERGKKTDADAIVMAAYGDSKISAFSWGRTSATGIAVRFLTDKEIADGAKAEKAADFDPKKHKMIK
jgi:hypothetical protein